MNFLEAKRLLDGFTGGPPLPFLFALSGSAEPFDLYLRAAAAKRGRLAVAHVLPFNTLAQSLRREPERGLVEVFLLLPWDFAPEADWRTGALERADEESLRERAIEIERLLSRRRARLLYLPAPLPPLFANHNRDAAFELALESLAVGLGARVLPRETFSLPGYFLSGCPVSGASIGSVAEAVVVLASEALLQPKKVLVTDLDNVMWSGGIGEDGLQGIAFEQQGRGYPHSIYQGLLRRLRCEGALLVAVSRNDAEIAMLPFRTGRMPLREEDFVAIVASYHAKSAQIAELASRLNLGLDSFVFVDDSPVELTEVSLALPAVRCVPFPRQADALAGFLSELSRLFGRREITAEDRDRTDLYRRRLEGLTPSTTSGADISRFLKDLGMTLTLHDRSHGDHTRADQLINKTNQFNLNGRRVTEPEIGEVVKTGGRLYSASLSDRSGSHGEILSCLVTVDGVITALAMSCRVFQRRVEHAFFAWLASQPHPPAAMDWASTPRNEPFAQFLRELTGAEAPAAGTVIISFADVCDRFSRDTDLFKIVAGATAA
ncbi:MAG: HAD-IIIC family phosphatase [Gemmatimonadota bacterium]|nr:HAD-IIIC family phosphatase [Gemmatimonadota bacterium]